MAIYSTVNQWLDKYPKLQNTNVSSAGLWSWLDEASSEADSYLAAAGIKVHLDPHPPVLVGKVQALAYCNFVERNMIEAAREGNIAEVKQQIIDWFKGLADGTVYLTSSGEIIGEMAAVDIWCNLGCTYVPTFGAGPIEDAQVDPNRIDDENDRRDW